MYKGIQGLCTYQSIFYPHTIYMMNRRLNSYFSKARKVDGSSSTHDDLPTPHVAVTVEPAHTESTPELASPVSVVVISDSVPSRSNNVEPTSSTCNLNCCQLDSPDPTRLEVSREATCREYGGSKHKRYFQVE